MHNDIVIFTIFLIFSGAALLSTIVLFTRQSLLVAYLGLGALLGPSGLHVIGDPAVIKQIGSVGIIFLLFLLGLQLHPQKLLHMLRKIVWVGMLSSAILGALSYSVAILSGFNYWESLTIGISMLFSSTIIGLKLLPTTILHHQHTGEVMISVLLFQDLLAIIALVFLNDDSASNFAWHRLILLSINLPCLMILAFVVERYILEPLLSYFGKVREYIFLVSLGWCLGLSQLAIYFGLPGEIGAFIAGVSLAASPIALYIAESLKPLRDFFLVMFFFSIGAAFDFHYLSSVLVPTIILASLMLISKPIVYGVLLRWIGETKKVAREVGIRLAQASEFSLLIATLAVNHTLIGTRAIYLIQATTIFTFIISSYIVVLIYPTPLALIEKMRQD